MREVVGGMLVDIVRKDVIVFFCIWFGVLFVGIFFYKFFSKMSVKLIKKVCESKLIY